MDNPGGIAVNLVEDLSPHDVREVLEVFRADITLLCERLWAAAVSADEAAMRRTAHSMAGAAGAVGASSLEHAARRAMATDAVTAAALPAQCDRIVQLVVQTLSELDAFLANLEA